MGIINPSGGGGAIELISEIVTSGSQADVTFSSIAASWRNLEVRISGRGTAGGTSGPISVQFNGDTGANYDYQQIESFGAGTDINQYVGVTAFRIGLFPYSAATAGRVGSLIARFFDYADAVFAKSIMSQFSCFIGTGATNIGAGIYGGGWRSSAAINSIRLFMDSGNFEDGSIVSLYGIQ